MTAPTDRHDVDAVIGELRDHVPATPREDASVRQTLRYLSWLPRPFDEHADPVHVTGSAVVLDGRGRVVLHRHKRLGLWLQPGGHLDPGETPLAAALRETAEETGLEPAGASQGLHPLVHVDVHEGGRGHLHLDLRYLVVADPDVPFAPAEGESDDVRWVSVDEIGRWGDPSVSDAVRAGVRRHVLLG